MLCAEYILIQGKVNFSYFLFNILYSGLSIRQKRLFVIYNRIFALMCSRKSINSLAVNPNNQV